MNDPTPNVDPKNKGRTMYEEADIGSGEKSPGQHDTDAMIREIPPLPPSNPQSGDGNKDQQGKDAANGDRQAAGA